MLARIGTVGLGLVTLLSACIEPQPVELPPTEDAKVAVALFGTVSNPGALVYDLSDPDASLLSPLALGREGELVMLYYTETLEDLVLTAGFLEPDLEKGDRQLPSPARAFAVSLAPGEGVVRVEEDVASIPLFRVFRFGHATGPEDCARASGCYTAASGAAACVIPCPARAAPAPPAQPAPPVLECGTWARTTTAASLFHETVASFFGEEVPPFFREPPASVADLRVCDARPTEDCPADQAFLLGRGCRPVLEACVDWPAAAPAEALFVRPGPQVGDGSRARPYATLTAALDRIASGGPSPIVLAPGHYAEDLRLSSDVEVMGCSETILEGRVDVLAGRLALTNVQLGPTATASVASGAGLTLTSVSSRGPAAGTSSTAEPWLTVAGSATISEALLTRSDRSIVVGSHGRLSLHDVDQREFSVRPLEVRDHGIVHAEDAAFRFRVSDCPTESGCGIAAVHDSARLRMRRVLLGHKGVRIPAPGASPVKLIQLSEHADLDLEDAFVGTSTDSPVADTTFDQVTGGIVTWPIGFFATGDATFRMSRVELAGGASAAVVARDRARGTLADVVSVGSVMGVFGSNALRLDRVALIAGPAGSFLSRGESQITAFDLIVASSRPTRWPATGSPLLDAFAFPASIHVGDRSSLSANRLRIDGCWKGIGIDFFTLAPLGGELDDSTMRNTELGGVVVVRLLSEPGPAIAAAHFRRLSISESKRFGVRALQRTSVRAEDLSVERVGTDASCDSPLLVCDGAAFVAGSDSDGRIERFRFEQDSIGLSVSTERFQALDGLVSGAKEGIVKRSSSVDLLRLLESVWLRGNVTNFVERYD